MHKGWFKIDGVQDGDRTIEQQLQGLDTMSDAIRGRSILDIGCAEGLIGRHCVDVWGAARVDGITRPQYEIDAGLIQCAGRPMRFIQADLRGSLGEIQDQLSAPYDVVLMLSILHKVRHPMLLLEWATKMAKELIIIRLPDPSIVHPRSKNVPQPVRDWMNDRFELLGEPKTCIEPVIGKQEWMGVWRVKK